MNRERVRQRKENTARKEAELEAPSLDTPAFDRHESRPIQPHAPPEQAFSRWLTVNEIRKMERMRREIVIEAMESGELPFEQRGRVRYARLSDVLLWEERRLAGNFRQSTFEIDPDFADLVMPARHPKNGRE